MCVEPGHQVQWWRRPPHSRQLHVHSYTCERVRVDWLSLLGTCGRRRVGVAHVASSRGGALVEAIGLGRRWVRIGRRSRSVAVHHAR